MPSLTGSEPYDPAKVKVRRYPVHEAHGAIYVHVSDNRGRRDDHLPVGEGYIDFPAVAAALNKIGYQGGLTLEIFTDNRDDLVRSRDRLMAMLGSAA